MIERLTVLTTALDSFLMSKWNNLTALALIVFGAMLIVHWPNSAAVIDVGKTIVGGGLVAWQKS